MLREIFQIALLPPGIFLFLFLFVIVFYKKKSSRSILLACTLVYYYLSTPLGASHLFHSLSKHPPIDAHSISNNHESAIVVLSAGNHYYAEEFSSLIPSNHSIHRLLYTVKLHQLTQLPILISGGSPSGLLQSESAVLKEFASSYLNTDIPWIETTSRNTLENATNSAKFLFDKKIKNIYLVTEDWHMMRAAWAFRRAGFIVTPAPTQTFHSKLDHNIPVRFSPKARNFEASARYIREWLGYVYYRLKTRQ
jgi:uncharacterized SAM-binding protein YcdF (DUF218 family)